MIGIAFAVIVLVLVFWVVGLYNGLVRLRNQVKNAWAQVDVQLKRRHDLIPNLVETVKGFADHERAILENITKFRSQAMNAQDVPSKINAESELGKALSQFLVVVENYPMLKANETFLSLQEELSSTENKIAFSRQAYNDQVLFLNNKIDTVPTNVIASMFNFRPEPYYEIEEAERETPKVSFR
ncbi:MAG: LemA family protein [Bacillota bacterium]|nr:LemA family protein [Bacillota bacterium]HHU61775.1 LemA family protein [Natronincola sp.]